jgi:anionic cell wall polymer biosynthesis LytR-Cps2A-Psr (LCP) family protein
MIRFVRSDGQDLTWRTHNHFHLLLIGLPANRGQAPFLTDTLMLISVQPATARVLLLSIPRDLLVLQPDGTWQKLNVAYRIGEAIAPDTARHWQRRWSARSSAFRSTTVARRFAGFRRIIDDVGGGIHVDRWFVDFAMRPAWRRSSPSRRVGSG